eukprot:1119049-Prymnesium_polylepis.2
MGPWDSRGVVWSVSHNPLLAQLAHSSFAASRAHTRETIAFRNSRMVAQKGASMRAPHGDCSCLDCPPHLPNTPWGVGQCLVLPCALWDIARGWGWGPPLAIDSIRKPLNELTSNEQLPLNRPSKRPHLLGPAK